MEIVGGFMVMMSIIGFFLAVVWLVMPFVVFAIKGKQDRTLEVLEAIEKRLSALETGLVLRNNRGSSQDEIRANSTLSANDSAENNIPETSREL